MRIFILFTLLSVSLFAQTPDAGRRVFESQCARCHGPQGGGGELGPAITGTVSAQSDQELSTIITSGRAGRGMPAFQLQGAELSGLLAFLHTLARPGRAGAPPVRKTITTTNGRTLTGVVINLWCAN